MTNPYTTFDNSSRCRPRDSDSNGRSLWKVGVKAGGECGDGPHCRVMIALRRTNLPAQMLATAPVQSDGLDLAAAHIDPNT